MDSFERSLADQGTEVFQAENLWKTEGIDVIQPPPKLSLGIGYGIFDTDFEIRVNNA